jgi:hypothetical protein
MNMHDGEAFLLSYIDSRSFFVDDFKDVAASACLVLLNLRIVYCLRATNDKHRSFHSMLVSQESLRGITASRDKCDVNGRLANN